MGGSGSMGEGKAGPGRGRPPAARESDGLSKKDRSRWIVKGLRIVFEDADVLVVDKAPGMLSATTPGGVQDSAFGHVKDHVRASAKRRGTRAWIIHRLDREASGLLVFAKSERAYESLKEQLRARRMERLYTCVVEGRLKGTGTVQSFLWEDESGVVHSVGSPMEVPRGAGRVDGDDEGPSARPAVTHYRVVASGQGRTLLQVKLETGRKHQIRVHMGSLGTPIAGDMKYGTCDDEGHRLALHATELGFQHPATGELVRFVSEAPPLFERLVGGVEVRAEEPERTRMMPTATERVSAEAKASSWDHVAPWYDELIEDRVSDHHERVILPGVQRLLGEVVEPGGVVLDVACGQGVLCRRLAATGYRTIGIDASPRLISRAKELDPRGEYRAGDARDLGGLGIGAVDAATCVMAIMNIEPMGPVFAGLREVVRPGGAVVLVLLHPAFRSPGQTSWGWEKTRQYRRVDGYLSPGQSEIVMNPGAVSSGAKPVVTMTYHRPVSAYVSSLAGAGFVVDGMEEWVSLRTSQPGPRAAEENRARREIPMFLAIRARRAEEGRGGATGGRGVS